MRTISDIVNKYLEKERKTNFIQPTGCKCEYIYRDRPSIGVVSSRFGSVTDYNRWLSKNDSRVILISYTAFY